MGVTTSLIACSDTISIVVPGQAGHGTVPRLSAVSLSQPARTAAGKAEASTRQRVGAVSVWEVRWRQAGVVHGPGVARQLTAKGTPGYMRMRRRQKIAKGQVEG